MFSTNTRDEFSCVMSLEPVIRAKLEAAFEGGQIEIVVVDAACHKYAVNVIAPQFKGVKLLDRHRMINALFTEEFAGPLHALQISAKPLE